MVHPVDDGSLKKTRMGRRRRDSVIRSRVCAPFAYRCENILSLVSRPTDMLHDANNRFVAERHCSSYGSFADSPRVFHRPARLRAERIPRSVFDRIGRRPFSSGREKDTPAPRRFWSWPPFRDSRTRRSPLRMRFFYFAILLSISFESYRILRNSRLRDRLIASKKPCFGCPLKSAVIQCFHVVNPRVLCGNLVYIRLNI